MCEPLLDLVLGKFSITVDVHGSENFVDLLLLLFVQKLGGDEGVGGLLQLRVGVERLKVCEGVHGNISGHGFVLELVGFNDPRVLQGLLGSWSFVLVEGQKLSNEIFGLVGDSSPDWISEGELTALNLLHNFLIRGAVEWWDTRQGDVGDDSARPDIALGSVVFSKDFWSNIIWSA